MATTRRCSEMAATRGRRLWGLAFGLLLAATGAGCAGEATDPCAVAGIMGTTYKFATNSIMLPSSAKPYSIDIDGDARPENRMRDFVYIVQKLPPPSPGLPSST